MTENETKSMNERSKKPHRKIVTASKDLITIFVASILVSVLVHVLGVFEAFQEWARRQPQWTEWHIHDYLFVFVIIAFALGVFSLRRWTELKHEITERTRTEAERNLLLNVTLAVSEAEDLHSTLLTVLRKVCDTTGWTLGEVWIPRPDGTCLECSPAWYSSVPARRSKLRHVGVAGLGKFRKASEAFTFSPGVGLPGRVWSSKRPAWIYDVTADANFPRAPFARETGLKAAVGIPVLAGDDVVAVMEFFLFERREEDERFVSLVSAVAAQVGAVIQRKLAEQANKQAEESLRESEKRFTAFMNNSPVVAWLKDPATWTYRYINNAFEEVFDITREVISTKTDFDLWPEEIARQLRENDLRVMSSDKTIQTSEDVPLPNGTVHHWLVFKFPLHTPSGKVFLAGSAVDITERKRAEEALKKLSSAVEQTADNIFITNRDGIIEYVNPAFEELTGYTKEEAIGKTPRILKSGKQDQRYYEGLWKTILSGRVFRAEVVNKKKNGELYYEEKTITPIVDANGNITHFVSTGKDITERKRAEEEIRRAKTYLQSILDTSLDLIFTINRDGTFIYINSQLETITGYRQEEMQGKNFMEFIPEHRKEFMVEKWREINEGISGRYETEIIKADGTLAHCLVSHSIMKGFDEFLVTLKNITASKRVEEALRESEERYRRITDGLTDYLYTVRVEDGQPVGTTHSHACEEVTGYTAEEFAANPNLWIEMVVPEDRDTVKNHAEKILSREHVPSIEHRVVRKDGEIRWVRDTAILQLDSSGKLVSYDGVISDITERKRVEEALRESELRFRSVWGKGTDGMRITNEEGIVKLVNDAYCKMVEKPREEIEGKPIGIVYEEPKQAEVLQKFQERFRSRNIPSYLDRELVLWNGKRISLELSNSFIEIPHQPTLSLSVFRDITERKRAEEALKEAEARYRTLFEHVPVGLYRSTPTGQILDGNPAIIQILGYPDKETYLKVNAADLYANSEERKQWQMLMDSQEIVRDFEEQVHQSDGTVIWVQDNTWAVRDAGGQVLYYEGILQDITQRKKMEEEREKLIVELQDALANIKTLSGLVPICASCKKIRDDKGYWTQVESYIMKHTDTKFSHGMCPDCIEQYYGNVLKKK